MSQQNNPNAAEERVSSGSTRKSAASAKPKAKAHANVTIKSAKKSPELRKAEQKKARREARDEQRRLDRKYYTPDTQRYKNLRRGWWVCLIGAVASTALSWLAREMEPSWLSLMFMVLAYALIIAAFYIDYSKIRKERQAYQARMIALEEKQKKEEKAAARAARHQGSKKKGSGKNASRNPKAIEKAKAEKEAAEKSSSEEESKAE